MQTTPPGCARQFPRCILPYAYKPVSAHLLSKWKMPFDIAEQYTILCTFKQNMLYNYVVCRRKRSAALSDQQKISSIKSRYPSILCEKNFVHAWHARILFFDKYFYTNFI